MQHGNTGPFDKKETLTNSKGHHFAFSMATALAPDSAPYVGAGC
jgi:hypothetical protein